MLAEGLEALYPMDRLAVMGLVEPLGRLPELLGLRRRLRERWLETPPDLFLGIDAPDFNLALARRLRDGGVRTAQLVSPTVWAWRPGRVHGVARSVDDLLCLFPFEPACYEGLPLRTHFVGHPVVGELADVPDRQRARAALGLEGEGPVIALLPGSRAAEVEQHARVLLEAGRMLQSRDPSRRLVMPAASSERLAQCTAIIGAIESAPEVHLVPGRSREILSAADVVLLASGTATLEAMLLERPMVIGYRVAPLSFALMRRLAVTAHVGLPNVLAERAIVPELLQEDFCAPALALEAEMLLGGAGVEQVQALAPVRAAMDRDFDAAVSTSLGALLKGSRGGATGRGPSPGGLDA